MKANLKNILGMAALGMTLLATTVPTWAGYVGIHDTVVRTSPLPAYAYGSMVGARYSAGTSQNIGCSISQSSVLPFPTMQCYARDSASRTLTCFSSDPVHAEIVQGMTDSSDIYFERDPATGNCVNFTIYDGSLMLR